MKNITKMVKNLVKDCNEYYNVLNESADKFKREHPVVSTITGIATGLTIAYLLNKKDCDEFAGNLKVTVQEKVQDIKVSRVRKHLNDMSSAVKENDYETYILNLSKEEYQIEFDIVTNFIDIYDVKASMSVTPFEKLVNETKRDEFKNKLRILSSCCAHDYPYHIYSMNTEHKALVKEYVCVDKDIYQSFLNRKSVDVLKREIDNLNFIIDNLQSLDIEAREKRNMAEKRLNDLMIELDEF